VGGNGDRAFVERAIQRVGVLRLYTVYTYLERVAVRSMLISGKRIASLMGPVPSCNGVLFATGVVDTGGKFATGIVDTGINNASENGVKICRRCR
jgi:hypothetical protein